MTPQGKVQRLKAESGEALGLSLWYPNERERSLIAKGLPVQVWIEGRAKVPGLSLTVGTGQPEKPL